VRSGYGDGRQVVHVNRSLKESNKYCTLQWFVGNKVKLGHFKRFKGRDDANRRLNYFVEKTKYLIPVAEMNLYDGIAILYEAQLDRDTVGEVSLCDDVLSVVRGFLVK